MQLYRLYDDPLSLEQLKINQDRMNDLLHSMGSEGSGDKMSTYAENLAFHL